jgi:charged multivesicular body protein 5
MNRLFGKKKAEAPAPTLGDASKRLDDRGGTIDGRIKKLDEELLKLKDQIQRTRGPAQDRFKQRALQLLQQKKQYEAHRDQVYKQQFAIDQLQFTKETMKDTALQVNAMKEATKELKAEFKNFDLGKVEDMQDELEDLYAETQEIQEVLGRAYGVPDEVDEDELNAELNALAFDMEKQSDASYLDQALSTPSASLPRVAAPAQPVASLGETTNPHSLEAQLGI